MKKLFDRLYKKPELAFLIVGLTFGLFSAIFVPQMSIADEDSHLLRSYQVANGEIICNKSTEYPRSITNASKDGSKVNGLPGNERRFSIDFNTKINDSDKVRYSCGSAGSYGFILYIPQAIGINIAKLINPNVSTSILLARVMSVLFYVMAVWFIIKKVKVGKYAFMIIALIPQMLHVAGSLSADMINNVVLLAAVAITINLFMQKTRLTRRQIAGLLLFVIVLATTKATNILVLLPMLFIPTSLFHKNKIKKIPFNIRKWSLVLISGVVALSVLVVLNFVLPDKTALDSGGIGVSQGPVADKPYLALNVLFNTYFSGYGDFVLRGTFGAFSSFLYELPFIVVIFQLFILLLVFLYREKEDRFIIKNKGFIIGSVSALVLSVLAVTYVMYSQWALRAGIVDHAEGVQGRYFTALLALLIPLFVWIRERLEIRPKSRKEFFYIILTSQIIVLLFYVLFTIRALMRMGR